MVVDPRSVLFVTLDSCRFDTAAAADVPAIRSVGPIHEAQAPSHFTFGSHSAMFAGFTPDVARAAVPWLNPKFAKVFKLAGPAFAGSGREAFLLNGRNIVDGFKALGYSTIGTGAAGWFDPAQPAGRSLIADFDEFYYPGNCWSLARQLAWVDDRLASREAQPVFVFVNVGETHVPYYFDGAPWSPDDNPCVPFQTIDRYADCRVRQRACLEFADRALAPLIARFAGATIVVCGDHGDCWGEDGLWEHGISHPKTLTVPLMLRVRGVPVGDPDPSAVRPATYARAPEEPIDRILARTEGMTSVEEARYLYDLALDVSAGCIVEIGAYRGRTAVALGRGSLDGHGVPVFVVEPHAPFEGVLGGRFGPPDAGAFHRAMVDSGAYLVTRLIGVSSEVITAGWQQPVSLLWIDGDHRYESVARDYRSWRPHLAAGATIVFDAAADPSLGPTRLVGELVDAGEAAIVERLGKIVTLRLTSPGRS